VRYAEPNILCPGGKRERAKQAHRLLRPNVRFGSIASIWPAASNFGSRPLIGHHQPDPAGPKSATTGLMQRNNALKRSALSDKSICDGCDYQQIGALYEKTDMSGSWWAM
jgi:hypothetical protein